MSYVFDLKNNNKKKSHPFHLTFVKQRKKNR